MKFSTFSLNVSLIERLKKVTMKGMVKYHSKNFVGYFSYLILSLLLLNNFSYYYMISKLINRRNFGLSEDKLG